MIKLMSLLFCLTLGVTAFANRSGHGNAPHGGYHPQPHYNNWGPRPGYYPGWNYNYNWYPRWYYPGYVFSPWYWMPNMPVGYWQCTAFNGFGRVFSAIGQTQEIAAYNSLYNCGGPFYQNAGCYIPWGYCQYRY